MKALVLFSGGQDSTTCLADALERYEHVETVGFDYGQRHSVEMTARQEVLTHLQQSFPQWKTRLGSDHVLPIPTFAALGQTALTSEMQFEFEKNGLPNTFVPARNLVFLSFAAALAYRLGITNLIIGACETDFSGYPDCRDQTMQALQQALSLGLNQAITIETPLMWLTKAQTWQLAYQLGSQLLVNLIIEHTHTCYAGDRSARHVWGYGCGVCPACQLRAKGFDVWQTSRSN